MPEVHVRVLHRSGVSRGPGRRAAAAAPAGGVRRPGGDHLRDGRAARGFDRPAGRARRGWRPAPRAGCRSTRGCGSTRRRSPPTPPASLSRPPPSRGSTAPYLRRLREGFAVRRRKLEVGRRAGCGGPARWRADPGRRALPGRPAVHRDRRGVRGPAGGRREPPPHDLAELARRLAVLGRPAAVGRPESGTWAVIEAWSAPAAVADRGRLRPPAPSPAAAASGDLARSGAAAVAGGGGSPRPRSQPPATSRDALTAELWRRPPSAARPSRAVADPRLHAEA